MGPARSAGPSLPPTTTRRCERPGVATGVERLNAVIRTILQRLGFGIGTLFAVSIIIFSAVTMLPGDFAQAILGQAATPETVAAFDKEIGLDRPPVERYLRWVGGVLQGDFGDSFSSMGNLGGGHPRTVMSL